MNETLRERTRPWLLLSPALAVIAVLFLGAVALGLIQSLNYFPLIGLDEPSLDAYRTLFDDPEFWPALALTLHIGVTSTLIAIVVGIAAALVVRRAALHLGGMNFVFQANLPVPHIVSAVAILLGLSQTGLVSRVATQLALVSGSEQFPALVFDRWAVGVIASYAWKEIPFIGVVALAQLQSVSVDYENVARTLGAGAWQRLRRVILPIVLPGVLSASVIVFSFTFGAFEVPLLLGSSFPQPLSVFAYDSYTDADLTARPVAMAVNMVMTVITAVMVAVYMRLARSAIRSDG